MEGVTIRTERIIRSETGKCFKKFSHAFYRRTYHIVWTPKYGLFREVYYKFPFLPLIPLKGIFKKFFLLDSLFRVRVQTKKELFEIRDFCRTPTKHAQQLREKSLLLNFESIPKSKTLLNLLKGTLQSSLISSDFHFRGQG